MRRFVAVVLAAALGSSAAFANDDLVFAAQHGNDEAVYALLDSGAPVDAPSADGTRALHWAIHHGRVELVRRLLEAGADVHAPNDYGATPMSEAAVRGSAGILEALLDAGADPDAPNTDGQTALMVLARTDNVAAARVLLERGADVNAVEQRKGQTALMWAAAQSRPAMVRLLIEHGADVDARSYEYEWKRRVTAEPRTKDITPGGFTPLLLAARQGCVECTAALVGAGADLRKTNPEIISPLLTALLNGHFDTAKWLIENGADVNQWDRWGRTPLYAAVDFNTLPQGGRPDRPSLSRTSGIELIELLLEAGANPNAQLKLFPPYRSLRADRGADSMLGIGTTPLIRAARAADHQAMALLIEHGALVDLPQERGITALMTAAGMDRRSIDTRGKFTGEAALVDAARFLLASGANVNAADRRGRTPLYAAASQGMNDMVRLLAEHGADLAAADADGFTALDVARGHASRGRGAPVVHATTAELLESLGAPAGAGASEGREAAD